MQQLTIGKNQAGQRLDKFLKKAFPNAGTGFLYKMLRKKNITLNGKKAEGKEILAQGDEIKCFFSEETFASLSGTENRETTSDYRKAYRSLKDISVLYEDEDIECFFVGNPRAAGHMCISTMEHYHDMSEAPDLINEKIIRFAKRFMQILCEVYGCERVYLCTMCDGPNNHYHIQLIPRYQDEKRGSQNFVKPRKAYVPDHAKLEKVRTRIHEYAQE